MHSLSPSSWIHCMPTTLSHPFTPPFLSMLQSNRIHPSWQSSSSPLYSRLVVQEAMLNFWMWFNYFLCGLNQSHNHHILCLSSLCSTACSFALSPSSWHNFIQRLFGYHLARPNKQEVLSATPLSSSYRQWCSLSTIWWLYKQNVIFFSSNICFASVYFVYSV